MKLWTWKLMSLAGMMAAQKIIQPVFFQNVSLPSSLIGLLSKQKIPREISKHPDFFTCS
jgi:hypothetical protein